MTPVWDWQFAGEILPLILKGLAVTLHAVFWGMVLALVLGLLWAILHRSTSRWIAWPVRGITEFIRSTPLLVQLFFLFYGFPALGLPLPPFVCGVLALGLHYSTYTAEVYRAGIDDVPPGQWMAAQALNLSHWQTWRYVILPQAIPPILPALGNYLIAMFKDAPLLSAITVLGILQRAKIIGNETFRFLEPFTIVGLIFLILSLLAGTLVSWLDHKLKVEKI